jgi:PPOX class probable F420-dependent enzyme
VEARLRFAAARVARLATVGAGSRPHIVPITFAVVGDDQIVFAVDHKPKRTVALQRLANIAANPGVSVLVDHYEEEWAALWWARADGRARVTPPGDPAALPALGALEARYAQYRERRPGGPVVIITVDHWSGWTAAA